MIMAQEQAILKAQEQFAQIQDFLRQAGGASQRIDQVELDLWGRMLQLGRQLLEAVPVHGKLRKNLFEAVILE